MPDQAASDPAYSRMAVWLDRDHCLYYPDTEYVNHLMTHSRGQRVVRFYDPDGNLIEVSTPV